MKISVIIVNYNVKFYLEQCLQSLRCALKGIDSEVYVVDNHSRHGSVEYLRKRFREMKFVASNHNLGFARANNLAIKRSKGEYVLLLNPDTIVGEDSIRKSLAFMEEHPQAGGLGVKMLKCDGNKAMESRRGLPSPLTAFYKMCGLCARYPKSRRFGKYYMSYLSWEKPEKIEVISGAYCLLRHSVLDEIGLLDEDFFMYGEDIDLSYRILKGGYENWYLPVSILHYKGESTHKSSYRYVHVFYEAMLIFFRKHYRHLSFWLSLPIKFAIYIKALFALVNMVAKRISKLLGFFPYKRKKEADYLFLCAKESMKSCRRIADNKGLSASYMELDETDKMHIGGQLDSRINPSVNTYVVCDTSLYKYSEILQLFENKPRKNVSMGTFSPKSHIVITEKEILR